MDDGWHWHPLGRLVRWDLQKWLHENVWESEDGPSLKTLRHVEYLWDVPKCFVSDKILAVWVFGSDDAWMLNAAVLFDIESGKQLNWFAGPPKGSFVFDRHLLVFSKDVGTSVWDIATGDRLLSEPTFKPTAYDSSSHQFITVLGKGKFRLTKLKLSQD